MTSVNRRTDAARHSASPAARHRHIADRSARQSPSATERQRAALTEAQFLKAVFAELTGNEAQRPRDASQGPTVQKREPKDSKGC